MTHTPYVVQERGAFLISVLLARLRYHTLDPQTFLYSPSLKKNAFHFLQILKDPYAANFLNICGERCWLRNVLSFISSSLMPSTKEKLS